MPIRLMIVEDNALQRELYITILEPWPMIEVVYAADHGLDALQRIGSMKPDVVLFDVVMPHIDGFGLLEKVKDLDAAQRPAMIALTSLGRDDFITRAVNLGVNDYLVKPVEPEQLAQRIIAQYELRRSRLPACGAERCQPAAQPAPEARSAAAPEPPAEEVIRKYAAVLMMQLGMPAHLYGYRYLMEAIVIAVQTPAVITQVTTHLYPSVAQVCAATPSRVERSIRNAIAITWDRGGGMAFNKILGRPAALPADKPSNSELIAQLAARIRMKEG